MPTSEETIMVTQIYVNLAVKDLDKSKAFFTSLGFSINPQFTDENGACLVLGENINAMLLAEPFFKTFTKKDLCDAKKNTEVLIALNVDSREKVDELVKAAVDAGGSPYAEPMDHGWMYWHCFADLDGHQWEIVYMDMSRMPKS
jgi:predicted lactoylglutathione lyase